MNTWQQQNLQKIKNNLSWLRNKEDGVLLRQQKDEGSLAVIKKANELALYFVTETDDPAKPFISGAMSCINIDQPLQLQGTYAQAMMLTLIFTSKPQYLYMMGFGGGIQSMIFHHYFPELIIHSSETDADVLGLTEMFFGLSLDHRIQVAQKDGRKHIAENIEIKYDIILLDCFSEAGEQPMSLATLEFYQLCQSRLSDAGIVALNIIDGSPLFEQRKDTFQHAFRYTYTFYQNDTTILFGSNSCDIDEQEIKQRAVAIGEAYDFEFSMTDIAAGVSKLQHNLAKPLNLLLDQGI